MRSMDELLLGAEIVLASATVALASFTAVLWRATKRLGEIEERRDKDLARSRRLSQVTLKLELAEKINREQIDVFMPGAIEEGADSGRYVYRGAPPPHTTLWFRQLYPLLDYGPSGDGVSEQDLKNIFGVWDQLEHGVQYTPAGVKDIFEKLKHIQEALLGALPRWRSEVLELSRQMVQPKA